MKYLKFRYINPEMGSNDMKQLCSSPDEFIAQSTLLLKDDRTTTLCRNTIDIGDIVIKRYNTKNLWHGIRRNFQTSRAHNCGVMSEVFSNVDIKVAEPLAVIEHRSGLFRGRSWFISRYIKGDDLLTYFDEENWHSRFLPIKDQIMQYFRIMQSYSISHGDMKASNILVGQQGIVMIDLDASRKHNNNNDHRKALIRDKARFLKNWNGIPQLQSVFMQEFKKIGI